MQRPDLCPQCGAYWPCDCPPQPAWEDLPGQIFEDVMRKQLYAQRFAPGAKNTTGPVSLNDGCQERVENGLLVTRHQWIADVDGPCICGKAEKQISKDGRTVRFFTEGRVYASSSPEYAKDTGGVPVQQQEQLLKDVEREAAKWWEGAGDVL